MIVYYSSAQYEYPADPEVVIKDAAVMVSFAANVKKVHPRTKQLLRHRRRRREREGSEDEDLLRGR